MLRKFLYPILLAVLVYFLYRNWHDFLTLLQTLRSGSLIILAAALLFQVFYYIFFSAIYQLGMIAVGIPYKLREMIPVVLSWQVVNIIASGVGVMGMALLIDDARRRRNATVLRATAGYLVGLVVDYTGIMLALILGFGYLFWAEGLSRYQVIATSILLALIFLINLLFILAAFTPRSLASILHIFAWVIDHFRWLFRRSAASIHEWVEVVTKEFKDATKIMRSQPKKLWNLIFFALFSHVVNIVCLQLVFLAFGSFIPWQVAVAGYAVGKLFTVISITPQGLGVVEGVMTLVFVNFGIPTAVAGAVVLVFRGISLWLPVLVGSFMVRRVRTFQASNEDQPTPQVSPS